MTQWKLMNACMSGENIMLCYRHSSLSVLRNRWFSRRSGLSQHICERNPTRSKLTTKQYRLWTSQRVRDIVANVKIVKLARKRGKQRGRLTAAVLIRAVGAVRLFVALVTCRDAGAITQAFKLLRSTPVTRTLGGCGHYSSFQSLENGDITVRL